MEVMPGYKQTEIGAIPEDWDVGGLGRFWHVIDCKHVTAQFVANGFPIASIKEVQSRFLDLTNAKHTTQRFYALLTEGGRKPKVGDLILSRNATVGEIAQVTEWHPPFAMGQDVCLLRKQSPDFSPSYLQAVFRCSVIARQLSDLMVGSTFKRVNIEQIKNFVVPMPPPPEQEAIAEVLSKADALIETLERLIVKKRLLKKGVMQKLLTGKKRLPGFSGEWTDKAIGEMGKCYRGVSYNPAVDLSPFDTDSTVRLLRANNVQEAKVVFSDMQYVGSRRVSETQLLRKGDILICMANGSRDLVGKAGLFSADDGFKYTFGAFMGCFRPNSQAGNSDYVFYLFQTDRYRAHIAVLLAGSSINNLRPSDVESLPIPVPSDKEEQTTIATILSAMDAEIALLEAQLAKYRQLKQGMMQKLLTGRIRLV